jgi:hypothetical protein
MRFLGELLSMQVLFLSAVDWELPIRRGFLISQLRYDGPAFMRQSVLR